MCSIDWAAVGIWIQAGAIIAAACIAARQFIAFNNNGRIKNTLSLLADFDRVRHLGISGVDLTVARAVPLVEDAAMDLDAFRNGYSDYMTAKQTHLKQQYLTFSDAAVIIVNYFENAGRLDKRNLIDKELFLDARSYVMTLIIGPVKKLLEAEGREYDFDELEAFVEEAREYLEKHPAIKPQAANQGDAASTTSS